MVLNCLDVSFYNAILVLHIWSGVLLYNVTFNQPLLEIRILGEFCSRIRVESFNVVTGGLHSHDELLNVILRLVLPRDQFDVDVFSKLIYN